MQTAEVAIAPVIKVILKTDAKALDEVVVTAMGISKEKKALGDAGLGVKVDKLTQASSPHLSGALPGKVSGWGKNPVSGVNGCSVQ
ncbi:hypothetical protein, partial [Bacteroides fragilis]|uniref:hypothetical protein n=1 Tax=Bacteroides fragilis TaxID=817 RepID=UPI000AA3EA4A